MIPADLSDHLDIALEGSTPDLAARVNGVFAEALEAFHAEMARVQADAHELIDEHAAEVDERTAAWIRAVHEFVGFMRGRADAGAEIKRAVDALASKLEAAATTKPASTDPEALLDVVQACAFLGGVSRSKLYELMASGAVPSVRVDRSRKIRRRDLVAYAAKRKG